MDPAELLQLLAALAEHALGHRASCSSFDLQVVLDALTESAARFCEAQMAAIARQKDASSYCYLTSYGVSEDSSAYLKSAASAAIMLRAAAGRADTASPCVMACWGLADLHGPR